MKMFSKFWSYYSIFDRAPKSQKTNKKVDDQTKYKTCLHMPFPIHNESIDELLTFNCFATELQFTLFAS